MPVLSTRKRRTVLSCLIIMSLVGGVAHAATIYVTNNFATVVGGEVYRSGQPSPDLLESYRDTYGIRTVINLRGASEEDWYIAERQAARQLGLFHVDFRMSADRRLSVQEAEALIALMKNSPKPILIHCRAGSDRTGLASALYMAAIEKAGEAIAEAHLSIRYGHFAIPYLSEAYPMDQTFESLEPILGLEPSTSLFAFAELPEQWFDNASPAMTATIDDGKD